LRTQTAAKVIEHLQSPDGEATRDRITGTLDREAALAALEPRGFDLPGAELDFLGEGGFGTVFEVRAKRNSKLWAVKRQRVGTFARHSVCWLREASLLNALARAPHILQLFDAFLVYSRDGVAEIWMVLEHFPESVWQAREEVRTEEAAKHIVFQVLRGLYCLHAVDIMHRDIKPDNILIDRRGQTTPSSAWRVVICDFGLARYVGDIPCSQHEALQCRARRGLETGACGTRRFASPEMNGLAYLESMTKEDFKSVDAWSLAMTWASVLKGSDYLEWKSADSRGLLILEMVHRVSVPSQEDLDQNDFRERYKQYVEDIVLLHKSRVAGEPVLDKMDSWQEKCRIDCPSESRQEYYFSLLAGTGWSRSSTRPSQNYRPPAVLGIAGVLRREIFKTEYKHFGGVAWGVATQLMIDDHDPQQVYGSGKNEHGSFAVTGKVSEKGYDIVATNRLGNWPFTLARDPNNPEVLIGEDATGLRIELTLQQFQQDSEAPDLIQSALSWTSRQRRGAVKRLLDDAYFQSLRDEQPLPSASDCGKWALPRHTGDIREEVEAQIREQQTWEEVKEDGSRVSPPLEDVKNNVHRSLATMEERLRSIARERRKANRAALA